MQQGLNLGHFTWKIAELSCTPPLCDSPTSNPIYVSACGVDTKLPKMEILLAIDLHCEVGSLIDINSYRFVANFAACSFKLSQHISL